jgi:hypothetical protein
MKKEFPFPIILLAGLLLWACSTSSVNELTDDNPTEPVTFTADIQPILSNDCMNCHGSVPANGAPNSLVTYDQVRNAVLNEGLINRINNAGAPMPPTGLLATPTRNLFDLWVEGGFQED